MEVGVRTTEGLDDGCAGQGPRALGGAAGTVPVSREDTEVPVLGQQQWEAVHERRGRGQSISAIARDLELDRKTVRSCLQQGSWQPYRRIAASTLLDEHRAWLLERAPQVNFSARILWQELRSHHGFTGSYVIVRRAVVPLRLEASRSQTCRSRLRRRRGASRSTWTALRFRVGTRSTPLAFIATTSPETSPGEPGPTSIV